MGRPEFKLKLTLADHFRMPKYFPGGGGSMWELTAAQRALLIGPNEKERKLRGKKLYSQAQLEALVERANQPKESEPPPDVTSDPVLYGEVINGANPA